MRNQCLGVIVLALGFGWVGMATSEGLPRHLRRVDVATASLLIGGDTPCETLSGTSNVCCGTITAPRQNAVGVDNAEKGNTTTMSLCNAVEGSTCTYSAVSGCNAKPPKPPES